MLQRLEGVKEEGTLLTQKTKVFGNWARNTG